jgi:GT2 family glycosyltransferase
MTRQASTSVVLVSFNSAREIQRSLTALRAQTLPHSVIVVDNASTDGPLSTTASRFPEATFMPLRRNVGFARAANIGFLRSAPAEYVVMLNPDTVPNPDFLENLVTPFALDSRIGAVGGTLVFTSAPHIIASAGIDVHRNGVAIDSRLGCRAETFSSVDAVFGASGGAVAYRSAAFRDVGGFCEPFFLYLEDVDLAWRLRLRGWDAVTNAAAIATHDYSASAIEGSRFKRRLLARNRIWTLARCLPEALWSRDCRSILGFDAAAAGFALARGDGASFTGRAAAVSALPVRLAERTRIQSAASTDWQEIDRWVQLAISPARLLELRRVTAHFAAPQQG